VIFSGLRNLESQLLGLVWRGGKIDHLNGDHDDYANAASGAVKIAVSKPAVDTSRPAIHLGIVETDSTIDVEQEFMNQISGGWNPA
jgi:hypothetical protein